MKITKLIHRLRHYATLNNGAIIVAALIALSWLWGTVVTLQKNFVLQQEVDALDERIQISEIENANLGFQRQYYKSNEYLELAARDKLGKATPGEKLIILPPVPEAPKTEETDTVSPVVEPSNLEQWMRFFFGRQSSNS